MMNKEQLLKAKECIMQDIGNGGCAKCPSFKDECPAYKMDVVNTALEYNKMIVSILEVIQPMVQDWTVCPSCKGTWCEHEADCELKKVVTEASAMIK